jgi:hypothetical protein
MTTPWEPPLAGTEAEQLLGALDRLRWTFRWKADGLDAAGLNATVGASALTLGGLLKHLALVEDHTIRVKWHGEQPDPRWDGDEFVTASADEPAGLYADYDAAVARSRSALAAAGGLDQPVHAAGGRANLRRLVGDLIEEYGRHTGHADLLREAVDGRTGEDPPPGWQPVS